MPHLCNAAVFAPAPAVNRQCTLPPGHAGEHQYARDRPAEDRAAAARDALGEAMALIRLRIARAMETDSSKDVPTVLGELHEAIRARRDTWGK